MKGPPWWQSAVFYQIYPRSFADSDGDGIGDLDGIRAHIDHLRALGIDAIWLSPFYRSPMADYGYDVSDHCDVDPLFGTLAEADALLAEAHQAGLRVIIDLVPNHTSDQHPWFVESRSSRDNPKRDWYVWRDPAPDGGPPNNWVASFAQVPAWTFDESTGQWYLHNFLPEQPELDWSNPEVEAAMHDVMRFWLDRGVDGFRIDVAHLIGKAPDLADDPEDLIPIPHSALNHRPETHELLRRMRTLVDRHAGQPMMVGEVVLLDVAMVAEYYGHDDELHLVFSYPLVWSQWDAQQWRTQIAATEAQTAARGAWPCWVLSNHDNPRHRTRYGGSEERARAAAVALLGLRGTPFLYAGEEIGLEDASVPSERANDPGGRDGCRAPLPWDPSPTHGWATAQPWLPWPPDPQRRNVATELDDPDSVLNLYRRLLAARRSAPALRLGTMELLATPRSILGWVRRHDGDERIVLVNFSSEQVRVDGIHGIVEVSTHTDAEGLAFSGELGPDQAVVLA